MNLDLNKTDIPNVSTQEPFAMRCKKWLGNASTFLSDTSSLKFIVITLALTYIIPFVLIIPFKVIGVEDIILSEAPSVSKRGVVMMFLLGVIFAPIYETILFQVIPYHILKLVPFLNRNKWLIIAISSLLFGVTHWYSVMYIIFAFSVGFVLIYAYAARVEGKPNAYVLIIIVHMLRNLVAFSADTYF
ncbi:CPBP intramembrane metalloprotease [anaerobic digester metagenome]